MKDRRNSSISVIIPVYNAEQTLPLLIKRLEKALINLTPSYEIILVNDGSTDKSWKIIRRAVKINRSICGLNLVRNYGQHNALLCGIRAAKKEICITMDDDLQNRVSEIPKMINRLNRGFDLVYGVPECEKYGLLRSFATRITKIILERFIGIKTARKISAYRAFRTKLRNAFINYSGPNPSIDVLLAWTTTNMSFIKVRFDYRYRGKSNYTFSKLITHVFNMITGYSTVPLQFSIIIGFIILLFGICIFVYVLINYYVFHNRVQGFAFITAIITIYAGTQLFSIGMMGIYIAKMHLRIMEKPQYIISDKAQ